MKRTILLLAALVFAAGTANAQEMPPILPCGLSGAPSNVPCYDTKSEKVIHTGSQMALPHQTPINPLPGPSSTSGKVTVPKIPPASVTPAGPLAKAPYWTFKANTAYYHNGDQTQEIGIGDLQSALSAEQPARNFENGERMGAAAGGIVGALIGRWLAHRRRLKLERKNIKQQIVAYYDATLRLDKQARAELKGLKVNCNALALLDPPRRHLYEQMGIGATKIDALYAKVPATILKGKPMVLAAKDMGFLRGMLANAKRFYNFCLWGSRKTYVPWQFTGVLRGYFEWRQSPSLGKSR